MQLSARPLLSSRDAPLYVPRAEVDLPLRRALESGLNALVLGPRGAGKTSAVLQSARATGTELSIVNAGLAGSALDLINLVADGVGVRMPVAARAAQLARLDAPSRSLASKVAVLRVEEPQTVLIDNLADPEIASEFFGGLRDELWETNINFVTVAEPEAAPVLLAPPADAFFDVRVVLGGFDEQAQRELLVRRDAAALDSVVDREGALPRVVLDRARAVQLNGEATAAASERARELGPSHRRVLEVMRRIDRPVAAGDSELLREVGMSRASAARALSRLEQVGLAHSWRAKDGRNGRPPLMYLLTDSAVAA